MSGDELILIVVCIIFAIGYHLMAIDRALKNGKEKGHQEARLLYAKNPSAIPKIIVVRTKDGFVEREILEPWDYELHSSRLGSRESAQAALNQLSSELSHLQYRKAMLQKFPLLQNLSVFVGGFYVMWIAPFKYFAGKSYSPDWLDYIGTVGVIGLVTFVIRIFRYRLSFEDWQRLRKLENEVHLLEYHIAALGLATAPSGAKSL
jgi:hypothetical protein